MPQHVPSGQVLLTPLSFSHRRLPAVVLRWTVYVPMCIVVHKGTAPTRQPPAPGACQQRLLTTLEPPALLKPGASAVTVPWALMSGC